MMNSVLADAIARIRNGYNARLPVVELINSKLVKNILQVLQNEGFIGSFLVSENNPYRIRVELQYHNMKPALRIIKLHSKPGCKVYIKNREIKYMVNGFGIRILSTNRGVITDVDAKKHGIGGELLLEVN